MLKPNLHLLPVRTGAAAENMALDFLLLQRYPEPAAPRFRHYEWRGAAFTFGYSQKIAFVRAQLPAGETFDLCRRPTGGGIVDHRNDWTYTLVLPRGHALYDARATDAYRAVHAALAEALVGLGQPAELKKEGEPCETGPGLPAEALAKAGVCFQRAELYDVVNSATGAKIAGAAMKRNKHGLLLQGSIEKASVGAVDWEDFGGRFTAALGRAIGAAPVETPWPELNEDEVSGLIDQYSTPEWVEYR
ncbi:MAG: lipoate--protein ligase family protein [Opitutae bacterium]|nr:lipoate--protein ligase family protein [Opitutae bacterium]